jgi:curved DNA-binding protein CbpA
VSDEASVALLKGGGCRREGDVRMNAGDADYYQILQVDADAEPEVIEAAYRRLARKYHPDVSSSPEAARRMKEINTAFEVLGDPGKRADYDRRRARQTEAHARPSRDTDVAVTASRPKAGRFGSATLAFAGGAVIATAVAVSVVALLLLRGDGGEKISLDEYFRQLDAVEESMKTSVSALDQQSGEAVGQDVQATRDYVDAYYNIVQQGLNDVKALQPPAEAKDAQDEFVASLANMLSLWQDLSVRLADVETAEELQTLLTGLESETQWLDTSQKFTDACRALQTIATDKGIDVTLDCE